jgi:hypothetical protein
MMCVRSDPTDPSSEQKGAPIGRALLLGADCWPISPWLLLKTLFGDETDGVIADREDFTPVMRELALAILQQIAHK